MPRVPKKSKLSTPIPKTKTFTGCWTCRGRKVKCDGARPVCERCRKSGRDCGGYDVKLYWITEEDKGTLPSAIRRQAMSLSTASSTGIQINGRAWAYRSDEVDRYIEDIDFQGNMELSEETVSKGPFSVFVVTTKSPAASSDTSFDEAISTALTETNDLERVNKPFTLPFHMAASSRHLSSSLDIQLLPSLNPSIFRDTITDILVANYVFEVANVLTPLPHPENPYASIYMPKALDGAAAVDCSLDCIPTSVSPSNIAIFYALMATSAFHLQSKDTNAGYGFDALARNLRGKAIGFLRKALAESFVDDAGTVFVGRSRQSLSAAEATISAMLNLITIDIVEGSMSEYRIHLAGIERFASQLRKHTQLPPSITRLLTISSFLSTISDTTSIDKPALPWSETIIDSPDFPREDPDFEYGLEFTYGITPSLISLMRKIVALSQNISHYTSQSADFPSSLCSACQAVSDSLSQWSIDDEPLANLFSGPDMHVTLRLAKHHILAFACGLRVYYHTRILPCSSSEMAYHVGCTAHHLLTIEEIKKSAGLNPNVGTSITWPGFIASCEASRGHAREVWYRWWDGMSKHSIGNIAHLWDIVQKAWDLRDTRGSVEVPGWMPVLRASGKRILAV